MVHMRYPNSTNMHTHGLHVYPGIIGPGPVRRLRAGCADARREARRVATVRVPPPRGPPEGMYWYHPHMHGSSAMQVAGWMAGALIVKGAIDRMPEIAAAAERVFVFQAPIYDANGRLDSFAQVANNPTTNSKP